MSTAVEQLDAGRDYSDLLRAIARGPAAPPRFRGEAARVIPLDGQSLAVGSDLACDLVLSSDLVTPKHATIEPWPDGFAIHDGKSRTGTFVNGRGVIWSPLRPGDLVQIGPYLFHYQKTHLLWLKQSAALTLAGVNIRHAIGAQLLLDDVSLVARPGEFIGLLGPSGAGKTTLLNILSGNVPLARGQVLINGESLVDFPDRWRAQIGYVPQEDIVHLELTPRQAFRFAAKLRLPADASAEERSSHVEKTLDLLQLFERADLPIAKLSGGQRKRVSVGVELLGRPRLLFLDEPTSGLDPSTEAKLMATLRELAHQGRTVLCTTHIMENVDLFDRIAVLAPGGKLAYFGPPDEAQPFFEVDRFSRIYDRLDEKPPAQWQADFLTSPQAWRLRQDVAAERQARPFHQQEQPEPARRISSLTQWGLLSYRFLRTLLADPKTRLLLVAQPVIIGGLISLVFSDVRSLTFLLVIATVWFGCGLAAQQIVKERAILRRERRVALEWLPYLLSKFILLSLLTFVQALAMWAMVGNLRSLPGEIAWQLASLGLAAMNGVAFGLVISRFAATADSAAASVPLTLIPQIVLAGFLLPLPDMNPATKALANATPARWSYQLMDAAWLDGRRMDAELFKSSTVMYGMMNLYPDVDFKDMEKRKKFLDDHKDGRVEQSAASQFSMAVLLGLCAAQIAALTAAGSGKN